MSNLSEISVAILAGGLGTRLAPVLSGTQKVVAKVRNHPFLEYILSQLNKAGFKSVVICTGHLGNQVKREFGNNYINLSLRYSQENSELDTAGAIRLALSKLDSEDILIMNGDSYYDLNLQSFYDFHLKKRAKISIILKQMGDTSRYGRVSMDEDGQVVGFEEKGKNGEGYIQISEPDESICDNPENANYSIYLSYDELKEVDFKRIGWEFGKNKNPNARFIFEK